MSKKPLNELEGKIYGWNWGNKMSEGVYNDDKEASANSSAQSCQNTCWDDPKCKAWEYGGGVCHRNDRIVGQPKGKASGYYAETVDRSSRPPYSSLEGKIFGWNYGNKMSEGVYNDSKEAEANKSKENCRNICYNDPKCKAWEYGGGVCHRNDRIVGQPKGKASGYYAETIKSSGQTDTTPTDTTPTGTVKQALSMSSEPASISLNDAVARKVAQQAKKQFMWNDVKNNRIPNTPSTTDPKECAHTCYSNENCDAWEFVDKCYQFQNLPKEPSYAQHNVKSDYYAQYLDRKTVTSPPKSHSGVYTEGQKMNCENDDIYYGANNKYYVTKFDENFPYCSNVNAGDPDLNVHKKCYCVSNYKEAEDELKDLEKDETTTESQIQSLTDQIKKIQLASQSLQSNVSNRSEQIQSAQDQLKRQQDVLEEKRRLLITRNRMLQLSQDRNIYKQKVIYTLLAIIILCFVLILVGYTTYRKIAS